MKTTSILLIAAATAYLAVLPACNGKDCNEWADEMMADCCAGLSNCSMDKDELKALCEEAADACGESNVECSGERRSSTQCITKCGCD